MSDRKKMLSKETGTVPKVKYWKNADVHRDRHVSNNLSIPMLPNQERSQLQSNSRNPQICMNYEYFDDSFPEDPKIFANYNSLPYVNMPTSRIASPCSTVSASTSRRHSSGNIRKCDNITKYPDKKQIEEKLNQIREYLKVTSTLMSSVKEDQSSADEANELYHMLSALRDSEKKLEALLASKHTNDEKANSVVDNTEVSDNSDPTLESAQGSFPNCFQNNVAQHNELECKLEMSEKKLDAIHEQQTLLMRLQEKAENQMKDARKAQERLFAQANSLYRTLPGEDQQQIQQPQQRQHTDSGSEDGDNMATQIRQIVAMKEQLSTLKDMLSVVKSTEAALLQNNAVAAAPEWGKQSNKSSASGSREQLQAELQAKRQELEELMYKDQDRTSAINEDVLDKAEPSFSLDSVPGSWTLLQEDSPARENGYSSDDEELDHCEYLNNHGKRSGSSRPVNNCSRPPQDTSSSPSVSQNPEPQWPCAEQKQLELMNSLCSSLLQQQQRQHQTQTGGYHWYNSCVQMQQTLMLNTLGQCCQLLWMQQQDINSLMHSVNSLQQQLRQKSNPPSREALNNQVAPGNRANNYWDNFRSYSRQNLLSTSTKSNEGSLPSERSNVCRRTPADRRVQPQQVQQHPEPQFQQQQQPKIVKRNRGTDRNRNEWNNNQPQAEPSPQKSKLFDTLRENVYREVTLLISANESRPHFLIQLFRDLRLVSSDPLRRSALQSIQALVGRSIAEADSEGGAAAPVSSTPEKLPRHQRDLDSDTHRVLLELLPLLKSRGEEIFHAGLADIIKLMVVQLLPPKLARSDNALQAKLDAALSDALVKFQGRRVADISEELLKAIADTLLEELSVMRPQPTIAPPPLPPYDALQLLNFGPAPGPTPRIDNGDLAEADQTRERRDAENEEGAIGGVLLTRDSNCDSGISTDLHSELDIFMTPDLNH